MRSAPDSIPRAPVAILIVTLGLSVATACGLEDKPPASPAPAKELPAVQASPSALHADVAGAARMTSPLDGAHFTSDAVEFTWTGTCSKYRLTLSQTDHSSHELFDSGNTTDTQAIVTGLPWNGEPVYAALYCDGDAPYERYKYIAWFYDEIVAPPPGSHLEDTTVTFEWTGDSQAGQYCVDIGSLPGESDIDGACTTKGDQLLFTKMPDDEREVYIRLWYQKTPTSCRMFVDCPYTDITHQPPHEPYTAYQPGWDKSDIIMAEVSLADTPHVTTVAEDHTLSEALIEQGATVRFWVTALFDDSHAPGEQPTFDRHDVAIRAVLENYDHSGDYYFLPDDAISVTIEYGPQNPLRAMFPLPTLAMNGDAITGLVDAHYADQDTLPLAGIDPDDLSEIEHSDVLHSAPLTQFAAKEQSEIMRYRAQVGFLQRTLNNHAGAAPEAYVKVTGPIVPQTDMLLFTFSVDTTGLKPGLWRLQIDLDPDGTIAEYDESNNDFRLQPVFRLVNDPAAGIIVTDDEDFPRTVNPCPDFVLESDLPTEFSTELRRQGDMRISEVLGPAGTGHYWSTERRQWISYYADGHPPPEAIRNVFLFAVGQSACGAPNLTGITETTQDQDGNDVDCRFRFDDAKFVRVRQLSYPGQLLHYEPYLADKGYYSHDDTLLVVVPEHTMTLWAPDWHEADYVDARYGTVVTLFRYLAERTGNFENVESIVLAGKSRGGHLVTYLGHMIKQLRETPDHLCIYEHDGSCRGDRSYSPGTPEYQSGQRFRETNPRLTIVTIEPSGFPLTDYGHEQSWCADPPDLAGMDFIYNGASLVPVAGWDLERIFPRGSGPYGDHTENLALLNLSGDGWSNGDDNRIRLAWVATPALSFGIAGPSISIDYETDVVGGAMAEVANALDGSFYTHWSMPGYHHFEVDSVWRRKNGTEVFNWMLNAAFDAEGALEDTLQCAACIKSPLSGNDHFDTGSAKRFSRFGRAFAQRFNGTINADREGFLQDVGIALSVPGGEGVRASVYADGAEPSDGALLAQSEVVRFGPPVLSFEFTLPFAYDQQVMLDPAEYYWLVIEFVDVDETSTAEQGDLFYYYDPDDSDTDPEWRMAREYWDEARAEWAWDSGPGSDDGVLRFSINYCKRQSLPCYNGWWAARYFDIRRAGRQWDFGTSPVAQRFTAERSGPVDHVKLWLADLSPEEAVEVCIHQDNGRWPADVIHCTSRGDLSIGGTREGAEFYFYYRENQPYVLEGNTYWVSVRMLSGSGEVEYFDVNYHGDDYDDGWFSVWNDTEEQWDNHAGGANNKDMWFGVYVCGD